MNHRNCQLHCWPHVSIGNVAPGPLTPARMVKLWLKRNLLPETKRTIKRRIARIYDRIPWKRKQQNASNAAQTLPDPLNLQAGESVNVRLYDEIVGMLNVWGELRGCCFMAEMKQYCGTTQRVLKPVRQFLDERDYRLKKVKSIVLLDNVICQGMAEYGPCDRTCYYFWREEWLERNT